MSLLGVNVHKVTLEGLNRAVGDAISERRKTLIGNHNLHSIYLYHRHPRMQDFYARSDLIHIDGMPLVWWARLMQQQVEPHHRVTYLDWLPSLMEGAVGQRWRIFYLGSAPGVAERATMLLTRQYGAIEFATRSGYFDANRGSTDNREILARIEDFRPDILMVGMGMPRQEMWIVDNYDAISAYAILNAGGAFDYIAGINKTPPRWMGRYGLEWLHRFAYDPRRLFGRYFVEPWWLIRPAMVDVHRYHWRRE